MRIGIDLRFTAASQMGTGAYAEQAAVALVAAMDEDDRLIVFTLGDALPQSLARSRNVELRQVPQTHAGRDADLGMRLLWDAAIERESVDVFFSPTGIGPLVTTSPVVVTIHDLLFEHHPEFMATGLAQCLKREVARSANQADAIVAISQHTANDVVATYGVSADRVHVVPQGLGRDFQRRPLDQERREILNRLGINHPYLFALSNLAPHKNTAFALATFAAWLSRHPKSEHHMILAGGGPAPHAPVDLASLIAQHGVSNRVRFLGRVAQADLPSLYAGADAFLFPSLFEGWGLPPLESMAMGVVPLVSDQGGLPEGVGDGGIVLPLDLPRWVDALSQIIPSGLSAERRDRMRARVDALGAGQGRSLLTAADAAIQTWKEIHQLGRMKPVPSAKNAATPSPKPGVGPAIPKSRTGISGCTIIRNGVRLAYPFLESIASYAPICDEIVIAWDPTSDDDTAGLVARAAAAHPEVVILVESLWDMTNRHEGSELARQTQIAFARCRSPWTLYVQADEALHEDGHEGLLALVRDPHLSGITLERRSFLGTLDREIPKHRVSGLLRLFRTGRGTSLGDAMQVQVEGRVITANAVLFNYSRLGDANDIANRTRNLHIFYHDDATVAKVDDNAELALPTVVFLGTHPAPIEAAHRQRIIPLNPFSRSRGSAVPRVAANIIARETDAFGADLFASCLEALEGYADQIVIIDNGLGPEAREAVERLGRRLPIACHDARAVTSYAELRNRALGATDPAMTHVHKIDTDEVYVPNSLAAMKAMLADEQVTEVSATFVHFMIDPTLEESRQEKAVVFRRQPGLTWTGSVHESTMGLDKKGRRNGPAVFLHLGYCRPQWQTCLKWLRYAWQQVGNLTPYQYEFHDGVRLPWFREGRTPDTILDSRRPRLRRFDGHYVHTMAPWLEEFARSGRAWRDWVGDVADDGFWDRWLEMRQRVGNWELTLEPMLRMAHPELFPSPGRADKADHLEP